MGPYNSAASLSSSSRSSKPITKRALNRKLAKAAESSSTTTTTTTGRGSKTDQSVLQSAYIQAYEAQLVYDAPGRAKEVISKNGRNGRGLIRWQGVFEGDGEGDGDGDEAGNGVHGASGKAREREREVWADRHDILHLLTSLPSSSSSAFASSSKHPNPSITNDDTPASPALTSSSWDSLPSDLRETFFLSGTEEIEEYERGKKRAWMEALREERLKEREREDVVRDKEAEERKSRGMEMGWGDDDEEPPDPILTLMTHTATSLLTSPNPSVLELRILANHASDQRFEFLKGRYKTTWERLKADARRQRDIKSGKAGKEKVVVGALLGGYESSDGDDGEDGNGDGDDEEVGEDSTPPPPPEEEIPTPPSPPPPPPEGIPSPEHLPSIPGPDEASTPADASSGASAGDAERQRVKKLRLEEWKRKRAAEKNGGGV